MNFNLIGLIKAALPLARDVMPETGHLTGMRQSATDSLSSEMPSVAEKPYPPRKYRPFRRKCAAYVPISREVRKV